MISLGPYHFNYQAQNGIPFNSAQFQYGLATGYPLAYSQQPTNQSGNGSNLPLTPPGSPDDDEESPLVICDSPQKTPQKQQYPACNGTSDGRTGHLDTSASGATDLTNNGSFHYNGCGGYNELSGTQLAALFGNSNTAVTRSPSVYSNVSNGKRSRNDKKPVPDQMKDDKYFERRRRNNEAAKKSRDARKNREDEIAARAAFLEKENAVLRAQIATLREEAQNLRLLLLQKQERQLAAQMDASNSASFA